MTLTLPQVRASLAYGAIAALKDDNGKGRKVEHMAWRYRLLCEVGARVPVSIPHRTLPDDVKPVVRAVFEGFLLLLGIKWLAWPDSATTFSWRFGAAWCGVTQYAVGESMKWLLKGGYIKETGAHTGKYGVKVAVFGAVPPMDESDAYMEALPYTTGRQPNAET
jgi:hypothetical protein